ncbi:MAG: YciI family protein [Bacteroidota bacterium]
MNGHKNFMMIFRFEPDFSYQPTEEDMAKRKQAWGAFIGNIALSEKLVSTYQLGFTGKKISPDLSVADGIHIAESKTLGGNMVVKAKTIEEATELAKGCPILQMGGTVEVREILPMS